MKYSALSTEEKQHFLLSGLLCSLAALVLVFTVLSCRSGPVAAADPDSLSDSAYQVDLYKRPPLPASSAVSGLNLQIDAVHLPEPDLTAFRVHSDAMESNPDTPAEGTEFLPDVTVLSRLLIISQLDLPEPLLTEQLQPRDSVMGEVRAAAESKRTETDRPAAAMVGAVKALPNPTAAETAPAAEAPTAGTPSSAAAAASAAIAEPPKPTLVPLVVPPVVEAEPSLLNVSAYSNQAFILRFSGAGWTFVGDQDGQSGIQFRTRQFENNEVIFSLAPLQAGEYLLLFRRQNPLNQQMESSLVAVTVSDQAPVADPAPG
ncbi:MAG: hypothetical protein KKC64_02230, partial [Spirochaetes bacterium]|nr:hypothetical protein [Spirochaetota bacterium]